ncbi:MAG: pyridoxamine kinase [Paludibacteraceae bacterium]|nr:pyridoxamine kinase [Paludibacteraceae bacterium]
MNKVKKVAAIHDLSGCGRVSLNAVIPILSSMGIQTYPLPTAILSCHTQYDDFSFLDLTDQMPLFMEHWKKLGIEFDGIYSGYLGSPKQIAIVEEFIRTFRTPNQLVVVDPVLGDNGHLYKGLDSDLVVEMREFVKSANVITPNLTEMCLLLDKPYKNFFSVEELKESLLRLSEEGPDHVIVTSIQEKEDLKKTFVVAYSKKTNRFWKVWTNYLPAHYPGTGDTFTSIITGALLQGDSLPIALDRAVQFIQMGMRATFGYEYDNREGILLERVLKTLDAPVQINSYELL